MDLNQERITESTPLFQNSESGTSTNVHQPAQFEKATVYDASAPPEEEGEVISPPTNWKSPEIKPVVTTPVILDNTVLTESEAKEVIENYVRSTCCKLRNFTKSLNFTQFVATNAFVITLDTYLESRKVVDVYRPYRGHPVDDSHFGIPPEPWSIPVAIPPPFTPHRVTMKIPHTEEVRVCHRCHGHRYVTCDRCHGHGHVHCTWCNGTGHIIRHESYIDQNGVSQIRTREEHCHHCHHGHIECFECHGHGEFLCNTCDGCGSLVWFKELRVKFETVSKDSVVKSVLNPILKHLLPDHKIKSSEGQLILHEENPKILPVHSNPVSGTGFSVRINEYVNTAVNDLLQQCVFPTKWQHWQRIQIRGFPVYEATYHRKGKQYHLWIVGKDRKVYVPGYPISGCRVFVTLLVIALLLSSLIVFFAVILPILMNL